MGNVKTVEKVVEFVQSETKSKTFRLDYPVSEELREVMVNEVFSDFMTFALELYFDDCLPVFKEYVEGHNSRQEKQQELLQNLFWWKIFYDSSINRRENCIEEYIAENYHWLCKRPMIKSWLRECAKAVPKFYFVGHKYNDRELVMIDIMEEETLDVIVYDPQAIPPIKGEIVMGTLIPLGGGLHFPIIDFYHFDFEAREAIANCLHHYYEKYLKNSTMHEAFIHVLSAMLQIESLIRIEKQTNTTSC